MDFTWHRFYQIVILESETDPNHSVGACNDFFFIEAGNLRSSRYICFSWFFGYRSMKAQGLMESKCLEWTRINSPWVVCVSIDLCLTSLIFRQRLGIKQHFLISETSLFSNMCIVLRDSMSEVSTLAIRLIMLGHCQWMAVPTPQKRRKRSLSLSNTDDKRPRILSGLMSNAGGGASTANLLQDDPARSLVLEFFIFVKNGYEY